jgi:hypothetical protein
MTLYAVPEDTEVEPTLSVRIYLANRGLTEAKMKVAERVALEMWTSIYGKPTPGMKIWAGYMVYDLIFLEEIEGAMLGTEGKPVALERLRHRDYLRQLWSIIDEVVYEVCKPQVVSGRETPDFRDIKVDLEGFIKVCDRKSMINILNQSSPEIREYGSACLIIGNYIMAGYWDAVPALVGCAPKRVPL